MKKFNINDYMYIQITEDGWKHLRETVGKDYIDACIKTPAYEKIIGDEVWYKLQCHQVFELLPIRFGFHPYFNTNVMFDDNLTEKELLDLKTNITELKDNLECISESLDLVSDSDIIQAYGSVTGSLTKILKL